MAEIFASESGQHRSGCFRTAQPRWMTILKRIFLVVVALHLLLGLVSSYRAWFQIHSVTLNASDKVIREGSIIQTKVVSYGRSFTDVDLELIQGGSVVTLDRQRVPANEFGFYDPRTQSLSFSTALKPEQLHNFHNGPAILRAIAVGREQWTRLPPPVVRELAVVIQKAA